MNRRTFLMTAGAGLLAGAARKPNIVLIVGDDLGWGDIGVQGCTDVPTPHIDSIAKNGVRFTNGYVSCPVCSPTRAGLMTGRYQQRFGHEFNPGPALEAEDVFGLSLKEATIAERLKALGYSTGIFGKWHLGYKPEYHPLARGFDEFYGFLGGAHSYIDPVGDAANPILRGREKQTDVPYLTDVLADEAVKFVERKAKDPFFLYLPFNAVHNPAQATEKYLARFSSIADPRRRTMAAMLSAMDDGVGRVLGKVRELKLENDTLIFFITDNGGPTPANSSRNGALRGFKGQALEGGIRVPFLMQWKGRVAAGKTYDHPVIALDIHPTAVTAAGGKPAANLDGVDLVKAAGGKPAHDRLFWRFGQQRAVRMGDWKLVKAGSPDWELYNLRQDIGESKNLVDSQPEKVKELAAAFDGWNAELMEPRWGRLAREGKGKKGGGRKRKQ
jgi:arylsulfatase A-like enzyme